MSAQPVSRWCCPVCGWSITDDRPREEQECLTHEGWWWCEQGHERAALVPAETDHLTLTVQSVPVLDAGLGIEAGYESDAVMVAAHEADLAQLPLDTQALFYRIDCALGDRVLHGFLRGTAP